MSQQEEVRDELRQRVGMPVRCYSNQKEVEFKIGYARCIVRSGDWYKVSAALRRAERARDPDPPAHQSAGYDLVPEPFPAYGRQEGDPGSEKTRKHLIDVTAEGWYEAFLDWATDILKTGRTVECGKGIGLREIQAKAPQGFSSCDHSMRGINRLLFPDDMPHMDLSPDYQRGDVWTDDQASEFVGFLLRTGRSAPLVPLIFIQRDDKFIDGDEVIDGKQRLTSIHRWINNKIPAHVDGRKVWYRDTNAMERSGLPHSKVAYVDLTRAQRLEFYLLLNAGGTVHTEAEIDKVRDILANLTDTEKEP